MVMLVVYGADSTLSQDPGDTAIGVPIDRGRKLKPSVGALIATTTTKASTGKKKKKKKGTRC